MKRVRAVVFILIIVTLLLFTQGMKVSASTLFFDNFTDVNGATLNTHNPIWECDDNSDAIIKNDKLIKLSGMDTQICLANSFKDGTVSADFTFFGSSSYYSGAVFLRYKDHNNYYQCNVNANDGYVIFKVVDNNFIILKLIADKPGPGQHTISCSANGSELTLFVDGIEKIQVSDFEFQNIGKTGVQLRADNTIDNFSSSPTVLDIPVPLWKQTNPNWKSQIYDTANKWSPKDPSIGSWGCALTSATMVLNYYNIVKLPDTSFITPGTLNKWLKGQKDGYIGNGLVNWLAISRLSKVAKASGLNPNFIHDALEFDRKGANTISQLTADIQDGHPGILQVPGHFIVAKGIQNDTFLINDPYYSYTTLADGYNNSFIALDRYLPSNTDLSYFLITGNKDLQFDLKDNLNASIGDVFIQDQLQNENNPTQKSGESLIELLAKEPVSGVYTLKLTSPNAMEYSLNLYLYDSNGEPLIQTLSGFLSNGKNDTLSFSYNHDNHKQSTTKKLVTFDSLIDDINEAVTLKKLDKTVGNILIGLVKAAKANSPHNNKLAIQTLKAGQTILKATRSTLIQKDAFVILNDDFSILIASLH